MAMRHLVVEMASHVIRQDCCPNRSMPPTAAASNASCEPRPSGIAPAERRTGLPTPPRPGRDRDWDRTRPPATIDGALMIPSQRTQQWPAPRSRPAPRSSAGVPAPDLIAIFQKTPRPREARAARVGGKRRPGCSLAGGEPATFKTPCSGFGSDAGATWGRLWVLCSRFVSMIFFHPTAEPVSRAHGCKSARPTAG